MEIKSTEMNVCLLSSVFPPISMGGVQKYLIDLLTMFKTRQIETILITRSHPLVRKHEIFFNAKIYRIGFINLPYTQKKYIGYIFNKINNYLLYLSLGYYESLKYIKNIDIIHSQYGYLVDPILGNKLAHKLKKRHVITFHSKFGYQTEDIKPTEELFRIFKKADYLIVNRTQTYNVLKNKGFRNVKLLRNAINISLYTNHLTLKDMDNNKVKFLFIGRLTYRRGPDLAVQAFLKAAKECKDIELSIVGNGPLEAKLKKIVEVVGMKDIVHFHGMVLDVRKHLSKSDIFLATSPIANSPSLSLREAMASGLAIIATDVEETNEIIQTDKNGILVSPEIENIKNVMIKLANNERLRKKLSVSALEYAQNNFDINRYFNKLLEIYKKI